MGVFHDASDPPPVSVLRGYDRAIALSEFTRRQLIDAGMADDRITVARWGPDLAFAGFNSGSVPLADAPVVATGKTGRDMVTLIEALALCGSPGRLYGDRSRLAEQVALPSSVSIVPAVPPPPSQFAARYDYALHDIQGAALVAIPLADRVPMQGLTELADALASARPVIVTRTPYFDIDVEEIGCGWWVEPGDVEGWAHALDRALSDRPRLVEMGRRGREWAERNWNERAFSHQVNATLRAAASPERSARGRTMH